MRWLRRLLVLLLLVGVLVAGWLFASGNERPVEVDYLVGDTPQVALWQALIGAFGSGAAIVALILLFDGLRQRMLNRRYRKAVHKLESEIHQLRNLPLAPEEPAQGASLEADLPEPSRGALGRGAGA